MDFFVVKRAKVSECFAGKSGNARLVKSSFMQEQVKSSRVLGIIAQSLAGQNPTILGKISHALSAGKKFTEHNGKLATAGFVTVLQAVLGLLAAVCCMTAEARCSNLGSVKNGLAIHVKFVGQQKDSNWITSFRDSREVAQTEIMRKLYVSHAIFISIITKMCHITHG